MPITVGDAGTVEFQEANGTRTTRYIGFQEQV